MKKKITTINGGGPCNARLNLKNNTYVKVGSATVSFPWVQFVAKHVTSGDNLTIFQVFL